MAGGHELARCRDATEETLRLVFAQLNSQRVALEAMILKPNVVLPGIDCPEPTTEDEVAEATVDCLLRTVPASVPGIAFLSGGQSPELASARLNAIHVRFGDRLPWAVTFSFSRVLQQPVLEIWRGTAANTTSAQKALLLRARCNRAARRGAYHPTMEQQEL